MTDRRTQLLGHTIMRWDEEIKYNRSRTMLTEKNLKKLQRYHTLILTYEARLEELHKESEQFIEEVLS